MQQLKKHILWLCLVLFLLSLPAVGTALAAGNILPVEPTTLTISPELPKLAEPVQVTVAGVWRDGCVPFYRSHQIVDDAILIVTATPAPEIICGQAVSPWSFTIKLDDLQLNHYQVTVDGAVTVTGTITLMAHQWYIPYVGG
ncbi:MAG: hypothetical protein KDE31_06460 [Caldilineaceae bacterium]|nr:hypothetical protein [Caldilineaceae bacterium]